ncbi:hypothetical protein PanWU01x14_116540 [Parasponia andersonii]|uniref:Uncharacterized protein n=1 Tax=Parasponia andersonii TaxID=3476 RepID=A0A2P5CWU7_PARAD|nr:hypothetical protein PanWU01x14_116540 [Parasponia andersonii]
MGHCGNLLTSIRLETYGTFQMRNGKYSILLGRHELDEVEIIDDLICRTCVVTPNDFLVNDDEFEDDTLEEYNEEEIELDDDSDTSSE